MTPQTVLESLRRFLETHPDVSLVTIAYQDGEVWVSNSNESWEAIVDILTGAIIIYAQEVRRRGGNKAALAFGNRVVDQLSTRWEEVPVKYVDPDAADRAN